MTRRHACAVQSCNTFATLFVTLKACSGHRHTIRLCTRCTARIYRHYRFSVVALDSYRGVYVNR